MSLSKKTYIAVAEVLRTARTKKDIITGLSNLFAVDNARFDPYRFREAINRKEWLIRVDYHSKTTQNSYS